MALFARRTLQKCLNEVPDFIPAAALHDWVQRLNKISSDYVATEWEVALLWAFSHFGRVIHEPPLGRNRIDLVFASHDGDLSFAADIVAISDEGLHKNNPIERLSDELRKRAQDARIQTGGFTLHVEEEQPIPQRGTGRKRRLLLPQPNEFATYIFDAGFTSFLAAIVDEPQVTREHQARHNSPSVSVVIRYDPGRPGVSMASYGAYTSTTVKDNNPLYNALKRKGDQLKASNLDGLRGIIVCDGGSRIFNEMSNWATYTIQEIIGDFFRQHRSVDFVVMLGIKEQSLTVASHRRLIVTPKISVRSLREPWVPKLTQLISQVVSRLPRIQQSPENALRRMRWNGSPIEIKPYLGGVTMEANRIQFSSRELLDLLAGKLDQKRFLQKFEMGNGKNIFQLFRDRGKLISSARLEPCPDEEDDQIVLELTSGDPAVNPFRVPPAKLGN